MSELSSFTRESIPNIIFNYCSSKSFKLARNVKSIHERFRPLNKRENKSFWIIKEIFSIIFQSGFKLGVCCYPRALTSSFLEFMKKKTFLCFVQNEFFLLDAERVRWTECFPDTCDHETVGRVLEIPMSVCSENMTRATTPRESFRKWKALLFT